MNKIILLLLLSPFFGYCQKIEENKIDDFTHTKVLRTSWEPLVKRLGATMIINVRISRLDSTYLLGFKMMGNRGAVDDGAALMLKLDNDSVVTLKNLKYQISCSGCGAIGFSGSAAPGFDLQFAMDFEQRKYLSGHKIAKVRIYMTDGYLEDVVKEKTGGIVADELKLIN